MKSRKANRVSDIIRKISPEDSNRIINLSYQKEITIPLRFLLKSLTLLSAFSYLLFGSSGLPSALVLAPVKSETYAAETEDRAALEAELAELEKQIEEYESTISQYKKQGQTLQSEINQLNAKISKANLQIKAINLSLDKLNNEIASTEDQIAGTENDINLNKRAMSQALLNLYRKESQSFIEILLSNDALSDFFGDVNDLLAVQDNLRVTVQKIAELKDQLLGQRNALALEKSDALALKAYQDRQKEALADTKSEKNNLLKVTKGKESEYQKILSEKQKNAAEIRNRIFRILGGGELPFGEAVKIAKVAEQATGVRAAFILAILTQESSINGVIGANLGRCYYNDPRRNGSGTVMHNNQKAAFLSIIESLGLDPNKTPVSCPIVSDGAYGGAMGPAQFMPNTWMIYKDRIAKITGGNPPSPFNNLDAFTATSLYLSDGLAGCRQIYQTTFSRESCAAAKYYAGGNWRSYMSVGRYGYRVAERAASFQKDIEALE